MCIRDRLCYETARRHNKPIAVMESVKGGTLANLPKEAENILREYNKEASPASYALRFAANLDGDVYKRQVWNDEGINKNKACIIIL